MANYRGNYTVARPVRERVSDDYRTQLGERRLEMTQDQWDAKQAKERNDAIIADAQYRTGLQQKAADMAYRREQDALAWQEKERARLAGEPMRKADLEYRNLEIEEKKLGLGNRDLRRVSPAEKARLVGIVMNNFGVDEQKPGLYEYHVKDDASRERMYSAIVDAALRGMPADAIAPTYGLKRLPAVEKGWFGKETPIPGRIIETQKVMLPRPQIDATGEPQSGVERGLANLNQQPVQDTPEVARARALVDEFKRRETEQPGWARTLSRASLNQVKQAHNLITGVSQPTAPAKPQGRIVSDIAIQDVNGDGNRDELDKQIAQSIDYVDRLEAKFKEDPTAESRLSPAARKKLAEMRLTAETYKSSYKRQRQAEINAAYGMGQQ
jgi:hypothetical protein